MRKLTWIPLLIALAAPATAQNAVFADHPIIGTWRFSLPDGSCNETYRFRADGTSFVTSGDEVAESEYRIAESPSRNGFYEWVDTIVKDNGKKDCAGQVTDVGRKTTNYIRFDPQGQRFVVCRAENLQTCFGPLRRVGGEEI